MPTGEADAQQQQEILQVGDVVERDIDGIWFPAKILAVRERRHEARSADRSAVGGRRSPLAYDLVYLDDHNRETEVPGEDIRAVYDDETKKGDGPRLLHGRGARGVPHAGSVGGTLEDTKAQEGEERVGAGDFLRAEGEGSEKRVDDLDDFNNNSLGDDHQEGPKVTIHSSHGTFDTKEDGSAAGYIINGPETNVAAGSGLRGIRWLRGP